MRIIDKSEYKKFYEKGQQHEATGVGAHEQKNYDAAITNFSIAIINYLDALSVNLFGKDLSSKNHEAAPSTLYSLLNSAGIQDFKNLSGGLHQNS